MTSQYIPENFLWGSATSSHQVEGNNRNNDWFLWELQAKVPPAGFACNHYERFEEDFDIAVSLGHTAHRFSLEWSRIEPEKGTWDAEAVQHYHRVFSALRKRSIEPVVTLFHFTIPAWLAQEGGWESPNSVHYFQRYTEKVFSEYSQYVRFWITLNEPLVYLYNGYLLGIWPPGKRSIFCMLRALGHLVKAHKQAYRIVHQASSVSSRDGTLLNPLVSIAQHWVVFKPCSRFNFGQNNLACFLRNQIFNQMLIWYLVKKKTLDFIGINYYRVFYLRTFWPFSFQGECGCPVHKEKTNSLGWKIYPQGLKTILLGLCGYRLPCMITENGTTALCEKDYEDFLREHLDVVFSLKNKIPVCGYFWWSLLDNYEWDKGYGAFFGLVQVQASGKRVIKPFAFLYKKLILEHAD